MASLNLFPNPPVLAVQTGLFLAVLVIIKKLFVNPYLKVRDRRLKLTAGNQADAEDLTKQAERISGEISERLKASAEALRKERERVRQTALDKRKSMLDSAEKKSRQVIENVRNEIRNDLEEQRSRVKEIAESLQNEVYDLVVN